jgi:hypothetical protein
LGNQCECKCGSSCACGEDSQGCSCGERSKCGCECSECSDCNCGQEQGFHRRYQTKAERKAELEKYYAELEQYQSELQTEMQAVQEMIADLQK